MLVLLYGWCLVSGLILQYQQKCRKCFGHKHSIEIKLWFMHKSSMWLEMSSAIIRHGDSIIQFPNTAKECDICTMFTFMTFIQDTCNLQLIFVQIHKNYVTSRNSYFDIIRWCSGKTLFVLMYYMCIKTYKVVQEQRRIYFFPFLKKNYIQTRMID